LRRSGDQGAPVRHRHQVSAPGDARAALRTEEDRMSDELEPAPYAVQPDGAVLPAGGRARRPRFVVLGAVVAVLALVLAGVGIKRLVSTASSSVAPAAYAPASTFAYVQVRLEPSAAQRLALFNFSRKFPGSPTNTPGADADSVRDSLLSALFKDSPLRYGDDVKPWLGDYAAVAAFTDGLGKPQVVGIVAVKDRKAASSALKRLAATEGEAFAFRSGYALLANTDGALASAQQQLKSGNLAADATFGADAAAMGQDQLLLGWVDVKPAVTAVARAGCSWLSSFGAGASSGGAAGCSPVTLGKLLSGGPNGGTPGRLVAGARVTSDYLDVQFRQRGATRSLAQADVSSTLAELPDDTAVAVAVGSPGAVLRKEGRLLAAMPGTSVFGAAGLGAKDSGRWRQEIRKATGLTFPGDIATVLGKRAAFVLASRGRAAGGSSAPSFGLLSAPDDMAAATRLAHRFATTVGRSGEHVSVRAGGSGLVIASSPGYAARLAAGGHLGSTGLYREAMATERSGDGATVFGAYVDLPALGLTHEPVAAVGLVARYAGTDTVLDVRIVAR
jgi:hypothetical protein